MVLSISVSHTDDGSEIGRFRQILPQIIASSVHNFLMLGIGLIISMPTIIIPALVSPNPDEPIHITPEESSWLGSVFIIVVPIGSVLSGWVTEPLGRKRAFIFVSIPHLIAWLLLYNSTTYTEVLIAQLLIGFGLGLMEAPLVTYIVEVVESSLRGVFMAVSGISTTLGLFVVYLLGSITEWRNVALYCFFVPAITMLAVCFIPETPFWLISRNRIDDAEKSLQWFRGWVSPRAIVKELSELKRHNEFSKKCVACYKANLKCDHPPPTSMERLRALLLPSTLKPLSILIIIYAFSQAPGIYAMRPYIVLVLKTFGTPIQPSTATIALGLTGIIGSTICILIVKFVGKRKLFLWSLIVMSIPAISAGIYGFKNLSPGTTSFFPREGEMPSTDNYLPLIAFISMQFINSVGIASVPPMLLSELLPYKTRGVACGIVAALNSAITFVVNKSYFDVEMAFTLPGAMTFYGVMSLVAAAVAFFIIPETEERTLEDIEMHFADKNQSFFSLKIQKNAAEKLNSSTQAVSMTA